MLTGFWIGVCAVLLWRLTRAQRDLARTRQTIDNAVPPTSGYFVEVECAACAKMNRIPATRLRNRPVCGNCKARLQPGKRIVLSHVQVHATDPVWGAALDGVWQDYDAFWNTLDAYFKQKSMSKVWN